MTRLLAAWGVVTVVSVAIDLVWTRAATPAK